MTAHSGTALIRFSSQSEDLTISHLQNLTNLTKRCFLYKEVRCVHLTSGGRDRLLEKPYLTKIFNCNPFLFVI